MTSVGRDAAATNPRMHLHYDAAPVHVHSTTAVSCTPEVDMIAASPTTSTRRRSTHIGLDRLRQQRSSVHPSTAYGSPSHVQVGNGRMTIVGSRDPRTWPAAGEIDFAEDEGGTRTKTVASVRYQGADGKVWGRFIPVISRPVR